MDAASSSPLHCSVSAWRNAAEVPLALNIAFVLAAAVCAVQVFRTGNVCHHRGERWLWRVCGLATLLLLTISAFSLHQLAGAAGACLTGNGMAGGVRTGAILVALGITAALLFAVFVVFYRHAFSNLLLATALALAANLFVLEAAGARDLVAIDIRLAALIGIMGMIGAARIRRRTAQRRHLHHGARDPVPAGTDFRPKIR